MGRKVAHMEQRNVQCKNLIERNNSKQLGCRWEDNTEVDFKENIWEGMDWSMWLRICKSDRFL